MWHNESERRIQSWGSKGSRKNRKKQSRGLCRNRAVQTFKLRLRRERLIEEFKEENCMVWATTGKEIVSAATYWRPVYSRGNVPMTPSIPCRKAKQKYNILFEMHFSPLPPATSEISGSPEIYLSWKEQRFLVYSSPCSPIRLPCSPHPRPEITVVWWSTRYAV